ncbi:MAG TPA: hypothetical protein DET40_23695 [Lentisphaeria bacterium]|nr:MAG: hypothetical protein A2X45_23910 [Lentisphaerae bacterium GWF2_50_93]HCE46561.1 hypothetical protein [Lentisphaeria bacterium]
MNDSSEQGPVRTSKLFKVLSVSFLALQVLIIVLIVLIAFNKAKARKVEAVEKKRTPVEVLTVKPKKVMDLIEIPARVEAWNSVELSSEVEGQVIFHGAQEGDKVARDAVILKIDDRVYAARKMRAEADILKAEADMKRNLKLFDSKSISEKDMDSVKSARALAESELIIAKTALEKCVIRTPLDGYLDELPADVGEYVTAGKLVARIEEVDKVKLVVSVPEKAVRVVKAGMDMHFIVDDGREMKGKIIFLATAADNNSLSYRAEIEVGNKDLYFRPGMIVRVKIIRRTLDDALVVPLIAVIPKYGAYFVYLADSKDMAVLREIKLSFISGHDAVVEDGVREGDRVIFEGQNLIRENEPLRILNEPGDGQKAK